MQNDGIREFVKEFEKRPDDAWGAFLRMHRTHQQSFWREIDTLASQFASSIQVDARNFASHEFCKKIAELDDVGFPFI